MIDGCLLQEAQERPRTNRRAAREAHRVMDELAEAGDLSESEPERAPHVHWRKRAAAAQKVARVPARKRVRAGGSRAAASKRKRGPPSRPLATHPAPPPPQLQLLQPMEKEASPIVQPHVVSAEPATKLRQHHHEFLSEYSNHQQEVAAAAGTKALAAMRQLNVPTPSLFSPELHLASSSGAAHEVEVAIAAMLDVESAPKAAPKQAAVAASAATFPLGDSASTQSSGVASSPLAVSPAATAVKEGAEAYAEAGAESDNASEASTVVCDRRFGQQEPLGRSAGSAMWRLPSDAQLLSFASCMAA